MLQSFAPVSGPKGSMTYANVYILPPVLAPPSSGVHMATDTLRAISHAQGMMDAAGTAMQFPSSIDISATFLITPNWTKYIAQYSPTSDTARCMTAQIDFGYFVLMGGDGKLVLSLPTGTIDTLAGGAATTATGIAKATADSAWRPQEGGTSAEIDVTFTIRSATWTLSTGSLLTAGII